MLPSRADAVDTQAIRQMLKAHGAKMKLSLKMCAHCTFCAESCFLYNNSGKDPSYMPSYKFIHSVGKLYRRKGKVDRACLEEMRPILWEKCVLCTRCYCPMGIDIPGLIAFGRSICRSQGVVPDFHGAGAPEGCNG